ncbi:MAG: hypothetical protein ACOVS5_05760, partial [Oligoflexus sp.]
AHDSITSHLLKMAVPFVPSKGEEGRPPIILRGAADDKPKSFPFRAIGLREQLFVRGVPKRSDPSWSS